LALYLLVAGSALTDKVGEESRLADAAVLVALYLSTHLGLVRPGSTLTSNSWQQRCTDPARLTPKNAFQEHESGSENAQERFIAEVWLRVSSWVRISARLLSKLLGVAFFSAQRSKLLRRGVE